MPNSTDADLRQEIIQLQNRIAHIAADQERDAELANEAANRLNLLESMLEIVPVSLVLTDENGRIILGNQAVEKMLRHPVLHSEDVSDYSEWISFHKDGRRVESHEYPLAQVIANDVDGAKLDVQYQRGDGSLFWMRIIGQPVRDKDGERIGAVVALIDIDREHHLADQQEVLIGELNHRVKNAFSVVKSIVSMSLRNPDIPGELRRKIDDRLDAYAKAHAKLVGSEWDHADLTKIIKDIVVNIGGDKVRFEGPKVELPSRQALALSMALYELSTNAVKYGSLSATAGQVDLSWTISSSEDGSELLFKWQELDGPETVEPKEKGFGSFIIDRALKMETGGEVCLTYEASGFEWQLKMPLG